MPVSVYCFRFSNFHSPAPPHALRGIQTLYQNFACANGANVNLVWPHIVPSRDSSAHPCEGIRFADGLSAGGYEGVRLADKRSEELCEAKSQEPERRNPLWAEARRICRAAHGGGWQVAREVIFSAGCCGRRRNSLECICRLKASTSQFNLRIPSCRNFFPADPTP